MERWRKCIRKLPVSDEQRRRERGVEADRREGEVKWLQMMGR